MALQSRISWPEAVTVTWDYRHVRAFACVIGKVEPAIRKHGLLTVRSQLVFIFLVAMTIFSHDVLLSMMMNILIRVVQSLGP